MENLYDATAELERTVLVLSLEEDEYSERITIRFSGVTKETIYDRLHYLNERDFDLVDFHMTARESGGVDA